MDIRQELNEIFGFGSNKVVTFARKKYNECLAKNGTDNKSHLLCYSFRLKILKELMNKYCKHEREKNPQKCISKVKEEIIKVNKSIEVIKNRMKK